MVTGLTPIRGVFMKVWPCVFLFRGTAHSQSFVMSCTCRKLDDSLEVPRVLHRGAVQHEPLHHGAAQCRGQERSGGPQRMQFSSNRERPFGGL